MAVSLNNLVRLTKAQVKPAAEMMARAFHDDPLAIYLFPDVSERKNKLHYIFQPLIRVGLLYGGAYATSPNLEGVIVWLPSEKVHRTLWGKIRSGSVFLVFKVGRRVDARWRSLGNYAASIQKRHVPSAYWYGLLLAVDPVYQGKGYGGVLLRAILASADREHRPCYLETQTENDVSFFQHFGFKVVGEGVVPGTDFAFWAMLRDKGGEK